MLTISKKKLFFSKIIFWIGIVSMAAGIITIKWNITWLFFGTGIVLALIGAVTRDNLFRCPKCRCRLLACRQGKIMAEECPDHCPACGIKIDVEYI